MDLYNYKIINFLTESFDIDYEYYVSVLKALEPKNILLDKTMQELREQPYKHIISIENLLKQVQKNPVKEIEVLSIAFQIPTEEIEQVGIIEFHQALKFLLDSYKKLIEVENKLLHYEPENEEIEAGIESLTKFGRMASVDTLAGGDILKHSLIIDMPYSKVFTKMYLESEKSKFQKRVHNLRKTKTTE